MKIAILGYSGSGKSTLAKRLGAVYDVPVLYLDTVMWRPGWLPRELDEARRIVAGFMRNESWVIDGNYERFLQKERLEAADEIVLLKFNRFACFVRALRRYCQNKGTARESITPGCEEKFDWSFAWWILYKGRARKKRAHDREIMRAYADKLTVLRNQRAVDAYLVKIGG